MEEDYATETEILCFENDIRQVLNNLIANAIDAMRKGGRIVVRAHDGTRVAGRPAWGAAYDCRYGPRDESGDAAAGLRAVFYNQGSKWNGVGAVDFGGNCGAAPGDDDGAVEGGKGTVFTLFLPCEEVAMGDVAGEISRG